MPLSTGFTLRSSAALFTCMLLLSLADVPVLAEENQTRPEVHLGVTATTVSRVEEPVEESSGSVTVLIAPEIDAQRPVTAPEVLRDLPGVSLQEDGTMGESATLTLRGAEPTQTLVMMDGVRLNSPFRGGFDLGNFMMDQIDQIEIVRGAQSALYGSDAMGGVVNLITRRPTLPQESSLTIEGGNLQTFRESLNVGGKRSRGDYSLTVSRIDTGGQFDHDRFGATTMTGEIGLEPTGHDRLEMIPRFQQDHKELAIDSVPGFVSSGCSAAPDPADCEEFSSDKNRKQDRRFFSDILRYRRTILPGWGFSVTGSVVQNQFEEDNPAEPGAAIPWSFFENTDSTETTLNLQQDLRWRKGQIFTLGAEYTADRVNSNIAIPLAGPFPSIDRTRSNAALYLQQLFSADLRFTLQVGVRFDRNSQFGNTANPKFSSAYEFESTGTRVRASWGTGFHAPTIQDLYFPLFGNPDLKPEKSRNWEVGAQQGVLDRKVVLDVAYYRIDFNELIQQSPTGVDNIGEARNRGVESAIEAHLIPALTVKANYTYLYGEDRVSGDELPFRPRNQGTIGLLYTPTVNLVANLDVNMVSSQALSADIVLRDGSLVHGRSPGYTRVDLTTTYHLFGSSLGVRETRFFVKLKNIFDREYQEIPGFPAPGINFLAGVTAVL
jgi:vitamin B12 transporter